MSANSFKQTFAVTATGAAMDFQLGGKPLAITIINETQELEAKWVNTMADGEAFISDPTGTPAADFITANGVTALVNTEITAAGRTGDSDGSSDAQRLAGVTHIENGFRIGTEARLNTASDVLHIVAEVSAE